MAAWNGLRIYHRVDKARRTALIALLDMLSLDIENEDEEKAGSALETAAKGKLYTVRPLEY